MIETVKMCDLVFDIENRIAYIDTLMAFGDSMLKDDIGNAVEKITYKTAEDNNAAIYLYLRNHDNLQNIEVMTGDLVDLIRQDLRQLHSLIDTLDSHVNDSGAKQMTLSAEIENVG